MAPIVLFSFEASGARELVARIVVIILLAATSSYRSTTLLYRYCCAEYRQQKRIAMSLAHMIPFVQQQSTCCL